MIRTLAVIAFALGLTACHRENGDTVQGYVDANTYLVAAQVTARIVTVPVNEGDKVASGALLVQLDDRDAAAALAGANARLAQTEAEAAQTLATFVAAEREFERIEALRARRVASAADLDNARKAYDIAKATVSALESQLNGARASIAQAQWQLGERTISAPAAGRIEDVYFRPGEVATAGRPLLSLMPEGELKFVFFVPEGNLSRVPLGTTVSISCDGCSASVTARVSYVSSQAEFTPPVIYSVGAREKLVFKLEARPLAASETLHVGQPIDVRLPEAKG